MSKNTIDETQPVLPIVERTVVELSKASLIKDKNEGLTIPEMATKYGLSKPQMTKACKLAGVVTRAKSKPKFVITE